MLDVSKELGIIMLDTVFPRIVGDVGNPDSFSYPIRKKVVTGASPERIVLDADISLLEPFIEAAKELEAEGVRAITTSCGFLALFQKQLQEQVKIPVLTSSLLQARLIAALLEPSKKIGILTANGQSLGERHFASVGIEQVPKVVYGMEGTHFGDVMVGNKPSLDVEEARCDMKRVLSRMLKEHDDIGAILLECTNMPPYVEALKEVTDLPIFHILTLCDYVMSTL